MHDEFLPSELHHSFGAWSMGRRFVLENVILPLERHGLKVICAPIPLTSLTDDVTALTRALERTSGPVVLAGPCLRRGRDRSDTRRPS